MRKHFLDVVTIIMIFITLGAFIYEKDFKVQLFKQLSILIESKRFGTIKNMVMTNRFMSTDSALILLSSKNTSQGEISSLYRVDLDSFKYTLLAEFPSHKNLNSEILFNSPMNLNEIIVAYDKGIMKINYNSYDPSSATVEQTEIEGFDTATSMECKGSLLYSKKLIVQVLA